MFKKKKSTNQVKVIMVKPDTLIFKTNTGKEVFLRCMCVYEFSKYVEIQRTVWRMEVNTDDFFSKSVDEVTIQNDYREVRLRKEDNLSVEIEDNVFNDYFRLMSEVESDEEKK